MTRPSTHDLTQLARQSGYQVLSAEQVRANRWLFQLLDPQGGAVLLMVQARPLVGAADVQDLAELVRLRRPHSGILLAFQGSFSPAAQRTHAELGDAHLRLCTALPAAHPAEAAEPRALPAPLKSL